jgi:hypothetical protein
LQPSFYSFGQNFHLPPGWFRINVMICSN